MLNRFKIKIISPRDRLKASLLSALFCALCAVLAQIYIPTPFGVSFTLQSLSVMLCGFLLPPLYALLSVISYILLGLIGIPVFSGFSGGVSHLFSFSGGFLLGFIALAVLCSLSNLAKRKTFQFMISFLGLIACYIFGILWFCLITKQSLLNPFSYFSLIFLLKDTVILVTLRFLA